MSKWHSAEQNNPVNCFVRGLSKTTSATNKLAEEIQIKQKIDVEVALCRAKQSCELFCERVVEDNIRHKLTGGRNTN